MKVLLLVAFCLLFSKHVFSDQLVSGANHSCYLNSKGQVKCWGSNTSGQLNVAPLEHFVQVSAGNFNTCAVTLDNEIKCWGSNSHGQTAPPAFEEQIHQISLGGYHGCAIVGEQRKIKCWGYNSHGQAENLPGEGYQSVYAGTIHSCAIDKFRSVKCWGSNYKKISSVPKRLKRVKALALGIDSTCALTFLGELLCWGNDKYNQLKAPLGTAYKTLSAGTAHYCAVDQSAKAHCWGNNRYGQLNSSLDHEEILETAPGNTHTCAVSTKEKIYCWGDNDFGQSEPPR